MPGPATTNEEIGDHLKKPAVPPRWLLFLAGILPLIFGWNTFLLAKQIPNFERTYSEMFGDKPLPPITRMIINASRLADGAAFPCAILTLTGFALAFLLVRRNEPIGWKVSLGVLAAILLIFAIISTGLYLPMNSIIVELRNP